MDIPVVISGCQQNRCKKPWVLPFYLWKKTRVRRCSGFTLPNSSGSPVRRHLASTLPETGISAMPRFYGTHFGSQITSEHKMPVQKVSFCIKKMPWKVQNESSTLITSPAAAGKPWKMSKIWWNWTSNHHLLYCSKWPFLIGEYIFKCFFPIVISVFGGVRLTSTCRCVSFLDEHVVGETNDRNRSDRVADCFEVWGPWGGEIPPSDTIDFWPWFWGNPYNTSN